MLGRIFQTVFEFHRRKNATGVFGRYICKRWLLWRVKSIDSVLLNKNDSVIFKKKFFLAISPIVDLFYAFISEYSDIKLCKFQEKRCSKCYECKFSVRSLILLRSCLYCCVFVCVCAPSLQQLCSAQNVNCRDLEGRHSTPLHFAAGYNRVAVVEYLLHHGADVHAKDKGWARASGIKRLSEHYTVCL